MLFRSFLHENTYGFSALSTEELNTNYSSDPIAYALYMTSSLHDIVEEITDEGSEDIFFWSQKEDDVKKFSGHMILDVEKNDFIYAHKNSLMPKRVFEHHEKDLRQFIKSFNKRDWLIKEGKDPNDIAWSPREVSLSIDRRKLIVKRVQREFNKML